MILLLAFSLLPSPTQSDVQWRGWRESRDEGAALMGPLLRGYMFAPQPALPVSLGLYRVLTRTRPDRSTVTTQRQDTEACPFLIGTNGGIPGAQSSPICRPLGSLKPWL